MNELIKLLFSNIYVVIVIIGVIMAMIRKTKRGASGNRMPSFGGNPEKGPTMQNQHSAEKRPVRVKPALDQSRSQTDVYRSEYEENDILTRLNEEQATAEKKRAQAVPKPAASDNRGAKRLAAFRMPQGDDLRKAVILAEVLGPPRAKRPYGK